jgi:hypothetical protein
VIMGGGMRGDGEYLIARGCFDASEAIQQSNAGECHFIYRSRNREYCTHTFIFFPSSYLMRTFFCSAD